MSHKIANKIDAPAGLLMDTYIGLSKTEQVWQVGLDNALRYILHTCAHVMGLERVSIWQLSADQSELICLCLYRTVDAEYEQGTILSARQYPQYFKALSQDRVIDASDVRKDPRTAEFNKDYLIPLDIHSLLDATLRSEGKLQGVVCFEQQYRIRDWNEEECNFAASIADLVSQLLLFNSYRDRELRFRALFEGTADAVMVIRNGSIYECNPSALAMFRTERDALMQSSLFALSPHVQENGVHSESVMEAKLNGALNGVRQQFEWTFKRKDGTTFQAEVGLNSLFLAGANCVLGTVRDISDRKLAEAALVESQRQLAFRTSHDALTELPNRDSLHENAPSILADAERNNEKVAVLLLDLNRFKDVNDTLGHRIGDFILQKVAQRLSIALGKVNNKAQLFRLGGDEFAIMLYGFTDEKALVGLTKTVNASLKAPMEVEGMFLEMGASIGIALFPENGDSSHALLRCADVAMYHAKTHGESFSYYTHDLDSNSTRRLTMLADLGIAIRENQLELYYQPRVNIKTGECNGCEALLRWQHPVHGMVPPGDFIPLAEMTEVIHPLSQWVLTSAMKQIRSWLDEGKEIAVAVNLSARNLIDTQCPTQVKQLLDHYGVPHHLLEIEITESALITDPHRAMQVVEEFHNLGIHLAIDDFGTGYSSMSYLKRLPIQTLKIDRSFVKDMLSDDADAVIVRSTIGLAHSFGLNVVAEGVEDEPTMMVLRNLQCEQAQGYHICRPVPVNDFNEWYSSRLH